MSRSTVPYRLSIMLFVAAIVQLAIAGADDVSSLLQPSNRRTVARSDDALYTEDGVATRKKRLAVMVVGVQDRATSVSKFQRVIVPSLEAGCEVDVYLAFVRSHAQQGDDWNPIDGFEPSPDFNQNLDSFNQTLIQAGARLVHFETMDAPDVVVHAGDIQRLTLYPPHNNSVGANAIRRYFKMELLAQQILQKEQEESRRYDFVLSTKDDDDWVGWFDINKFDMDSAEHKHMYDKDCASWDGVNDKTLLFGRYAFEATLPTIYSDFWMDEPSLATYNSETFTKAFLDLKGVTAIPVPFSRLPTLDSVYVYSNVTQQLQICQKDRQPMWCLKGEMDFVEHLNTTMPSEHLDELNLCA